MHHFRWMIVAFSLLTAGCHWFSGVRIENVALSYGKPSNVAALVSVTRHDEPVTELGANAFKIYEDGTIIDPERADVRVLEPSLVAAFHTVLLVDLGHGATEEHRRQLARAAATFVRKVRRHQPVTVLAFDGASRTRLVGEYSVEPNGSGAEQLENLLLMAPSDLSRNLRGAVMQGLDALDTGLNRAAKPIRRGTLVVFSRGPDVAGRVPVTHLAKRLSDSDYQLLYVDVKGDAEDDITAQLGSHHHVHAQAPDTLGIALDEAGTIASRLSEQYYLISYCSPSRAGQRKLRIEVSVPGPENEPTTDSFRSEFDATGFSPGCNSGTLPKFVVVAKASPSATSATSPGKPSSSGKSESTNSPKPDGVEADEEPSESDEVEVPPPNKPGYAP